MESATASAETRRQTCTDHASCCGRHFHGLAAFDLHRRGGECIEPASIVIAKTGAPALQVWTDEGACDKVIGCWRDGKRLGYEQPVTIWQTFKTDEQRERLQGLNSKKSGQAVAS